MGEPHEKANKDYLVEKIAEEIAKKVLKVQIYGFTLWKGYEILVKEPTPYLEWPYLVCTPFELDIVGDMGEPAREVDFIEIGMDIKVAWDPGRIGDAWFPKVISAGSTFKLENKKVDKLYIHALGPGTILIDCEGFADC